MAVGLELAAGQLGDPIELRLVVPGVVERLGRSLGLGDDAVRCPQGVCQSLGLGCDRGQHRQLLGQLPALLSDPSELFPCQLDPQPVGCFLEHSYQLLTEGDPPLHEVGLQRNQSSAVAEQGEPGPEHLDLAESGLTPRQHVESRCRLELGPNDALRLFAQLIVE